MEKKPKFRFNSNNVKSSIDQYRNINGIHYICYASSTDIIEESIKKAKELGLKYRMIKGELYIEEKINEMLGEM